MDGWKSQHIINHYLSYVSVRASTHLCIMMSKADGYHRRHQTDMKATTQQWPKWQPGNRTAYVKVTVDDSV